MVKRTANRGLLVGISRLRGGGYATEAGDEDKRLFLDTDALVGEGATVSRCRVGIMISDADAHKAVLAFLINMRPVWRNKTVRFINRGGFGPPVDPAKPLGR